MSETGSHRREATILSAGNPCTVLEATHFYNFKMLLLTFPLNFQSLSQLSPQSPSRGTLGSGSAQPPESSRVGFKAPLLMSKALNGPKPARETSARRAPAAAGEPRCPACPLPAPQSHPGPLRAPRLALGRARVCAHACGKLPNGSSREPGDEAELVLQALRLQHQPRKPMGSWGESRRVWPAGRGRFSFPSTLPW